MGRKNLLLPILLVVALPVAIAVTYVAYGIAGVKGDVLGVTNTLALLGVIVFWGASFWYIFRRLKSACGRLASVLGVLFVTFVLFNLSVVFGGEEVSECWLDGVKEDCPTGPLPELTPSYMPLGNGLCRYYVGPGYEDILDIPCPTPTPTPPPQ